MATHSAAQSLCDLRDGGAFLLDPVAITRVFTPADLTAEQLAVAQTARRFADSEVLPRLGVCHRDVDPQDRWQ